MVVFHGKNFGLKRAISLSAFLLSDESESSNFILSIPSTVSDRISNLKLDSTWFFSPFIAIFSSLRSIKESVISSQSRNAKLESSVEFDRLQDLYAYIDKYIDNKFLLNNENERKFVESQVSSKIALAINENLNQYKYQLSESDIELISKLIQSQLKEGMNLWSDQQRNYFISNVLVKNSDFHSEIGKIVKENVKSQGESIFLDNQQLFLDDLVQKILASDKLKNLINDGVSSSKDFNDLKVKFGGLDYDARITDLNDKYNLFLNDLARMKLENDEKHQKLLSDIDVKLAALGDSQFQKINENIRENVLAILGFGGKSGGIEEEDLKAWIQNTFIAKEYLEERLMALSQNANVTIKQEIENNSGILMKEINEQILLAIKTRQEQRAQNVGSGNVNEDYIRKIVKEILAIYDADKTGIVDYALESAGGQILSTRCTEKYQEKSGQISIFGEILKL
jgi:SUN domain-containing protein 1/2